jgi:uncharacterized OsmC-like protein
VTAQPSSIRDYEVRAQTTRIFGRIIASARQQHLVVDGPVQNGCPGEAMTPAELFLGGVAVCGAELLQVIAREQSLPLDAVDVTITGTVDRSRQTRTDLTTLNRVRLEIVLSGTNDAHAAALVEGFTRR